jgi:hypothetical protein
MPEEALAGRMFLECHSTLVEHKRCGSASDSVPPRTQAPREVDLFHVREERGVEPADVLEEFASHRERRATRPIDIDGIVVLSAIDFRNRVDVTANVVEPERVEETPASAGRIESRSVAERSEFRLACRDRRIRELTKKRRDPARGYFGVVIEKDEKITARIRREEVVPTGEPEVRVTPEYANFLSKFLLECLALVRL